MTRTPPCPREHEVVRDALTHRLGGEDVLQAHALECESCRAALAIVGLLQDDRDAIRERVSVPASGQVWWRAAIRARLESSQTASRPLDWMFGTTGACAIGLGAGAVAMLWPSVQRVSSWAGLEERLTDLSAALMLVAPVARVGGLLAFGALACVVLASLAFYLALSDE